MLVLWLCAPRNRIKYDGSEHKVGCSLKFNNICVLLQEVLILLQGKTLWAPLGCSIV